MSTKSRNQSHAQTCFSVHLRLSALSECIQARRTESDNRTIGHFGIWKHSGAIRSMRTGSRFIQGICNVIRFSTSFHWWPPRALGSPCDDKTPRAGSDFRVRSLQRHCRNCLWLISMPLLFGWIWVTILCINYLWQCNDYVLSLSLSLSLVANSDQIPILYYMHIYLP